MRLAPRLLVFAIVTTSVVLAESPAGAGPPETLARGAPVRDGAVEPGFPIDYVGVLWEGDHGPASVRFRSGGRWGPWRALEEDGVVIAGRYASGLVAGHDADRYQVRVPAHARRARAVAINTTDGRRAASGSTRAAGAATPVVPRSGWGADESLRYGGDGAEVWPPTYFRAQKLTVHHTATANDDPDPAATMRAIYRYHAVERGFGDIGYQYVVDERGTVYEGRWSGTDGDPAHDGTGKAVTAAHVDGMNSGNVGVAVLGTLSTRAPTAAAQSSLEGVLADLAARHGIDPEGSGTFVNPVSGATWTGPNVAGHRDWAATECPGGALYALLPAIRENVAARLAAGPAPAPAELHVGALAGESLAVNAKNWRARATVTVHDRSEAARSGATVTLSWSGGSGSCVTAAGGSCAVTTGNLSRAKVSSVVLRVTGVTAAEASYAPAADHDAAPTGEVAVSRP